MHYKTKKTTLGAVPKLCLLALGLALIILVQRSPSSSEPEVTGIPVMKPTPHRLSAIDAVSQTAEVTDHGKTVSLVIQPGDTLAKRLAKHKVSAQDLQKMLDDKTARPHLTKIHPGQKIQLTFTEDQNLVSLEQPINETQSLLIKKSDNGFSSEILEKPVNTYIKYAYGVIDDSLFAAGQRAHLNDNVIMEISNIFAWDIDFALDIRPGDRFSVLYEERYVDNKLISPGKIIAAEFVNQGRVYQAIRFEDKDGKSDYYAPDGKSMRKAFLRTPVKFTRISSRFSLNRKHPTLHTIRAHKGVDYAAPTGTPIKASGDGKVIFKGEKGGYGNCVIIQHGQSYTTLYAHMSRFAKGLKVGDRVRQGETVGFVGMTGLASGPHLHYEFRINDVHKNPLTVNLPNSAPINPSYREEFSARAHTLLKQMSYHQAIELARIEGYL